MAIKKTVCNGYVVDAAVGQPLSDGHIRLLDSGGTELARVRPVNNGKFRLVLRETCVSLEFVFPGFSTKFVKTSSLPGQNVRIKLLPDGPIGYIGHLEARPGETLALRVHSPRDWYVSLHRHGLKRESVLESGPYPPVWQAVPDNPFVKEGLGWPVAAQIKLPQSLRPGLFSITIRDHSGQRFTFPLVVAPPASASRDRASFVVIGNTNTWQAYNIWGGKSRYRNFDKNPLTGDVPIPTTQSPNLWTWRRIKTGMVRRTFRLWRYLMRAVKGSHIRLDVSRIRLEPAWMTEPLSVKRPMPNRWLDAEDPHSCYLDHLAANEWRALAWLERENFTYHYFSDRQLHTGEVDFRQYRGIVLIGHAEYWSGKMYERLHSAIFKDRIPLVNLAGNAIYQEVDISADGSIVPKRGDFLETCSDSTDVLCAATDLSASGFAAFQATTNSHWALTGVPGENVGGKQLFGIKSLIDISLSRHNKNYDPLAPGLLRGNMYGVGASGWEMDKLSIKNRAGVLVLARGMNKGGGADMFLIENGAGRFLFSAPSISFVSSLLVDESCSMLTRNILERLSATSRFTGKYSGDLCSKI